MKTSNKILCTAGALFLLAAVGGHIYLRAKYHRTKAYPQELLQRLTDTRIRALANVNSTACFWKSNIYINDDPGVPTQYLGLTTLPTVEGVSIHGDTLRICNQRDANLQLPYIDDDYMQGKR